MGKVKKKAQYLLPVIELVFYESRGEWRYALVVFDKNHRSITSEGVLGGDEREARRRVRVIAKRLGLVHPPGTNLWHRLVPAEEF